jgi:hypothetical protein
MNPSLARPEPASLFKGPLSGCLQDMVQKRAVLAGGCLAAGHQLSGLPFGCPPLVDPPTPSVARARHPALVGHFLFSAKFICMGKQKNRLTAAQRPRPHAPARRNRTRDARTPARAAPALSARRPARRGRSRVGAG